MARLEPQTKEDIDTILAEMDTEFEKAINEPVDESAPPVGVTKPVLEPVPNPLEDSPPSADVVETDASSGDSAPPIESEGVTEPPVDEPVVAEEPDTTSVDLQKRIDELEEKVTKNAEPPVEDDAPAPVEEVEYVDPLESLSDDDKGVLDSFKTEWPEQNRAFEVMQNVFAGRMGILLSQITRQIGDQMSAMQATISELKTQGDATLIAGEYGDVESLKAEINTWIGKQPPMIQEPLTAALNGGDPKQFKELVETYNQVTAPAVPTKPAAPVEPVVTQDTAHLEPVGGRVTKPLSSGPDPTDEEGAFAEALKNLR